MAKASKAAAKKAAKTSKVVRGTTPRAADAKNSMFEVLAPFRFQGAIVRPAKAGDPPVFIEMGDDEARDYQDKGLLGTEPGEVPETTNADDQNGGQDASSAGGATDGT